MDTTTFFATRPVFSLGEAARTLRVASGKKGTVERLKHHLETGRLKLVARGIYAVVPPGVEPKRYEPDPFLVAAAARPDGVFCLHSALDLLGAAHSEWYLVTLYTSRRRTPINIGRTSVRFLSHPLPEESSRTVGTTDLPRSERVLRTTGPERTLVEGFRRLDLVGGPGELVESAAGFPSLDPKLLLEVLELYDQKSLWAAVGWFLERYRRTFFVSDDLLGELQTRRPRSPQYLQRSQRGGTLVRRWNLIVPAELAGGGEPDER